jgi:Leucine-rich repeat (LRR) protein
MTGRTIAASPTTALEPEELALQWLIRNDTGLNLWPDTPIHRFRLQQRYALAILQVQRDGVNPYFVGAECEWDGVTCQSVDLGNVLGMQDAVTEILINTYNGDNTRTGRLSEDLGLLPTLIHIIMSGCVLRCGKGGLFGTLPTQIGLLTNLQSLDLSRNVLTGRLPSQIGQLTSLQSFDVDFNTLTGRLPSQVGQLINLQTLDLSDNMMFGSLPTQIGQLTKLETLHVAVNNFIGTMPKSVCLLCSQSLTELYADCYELTCDTNCCTDCSLLTR